MMNDFELDDLLRSVNSQVEVPASFRQRVWQRIESRSVDERKPRAWLEKAYALFDRPAGAITLVSAMGFLGLLLGSAKPSDQGDSKLAYVESVSPFLSAHK